MTRRDPGVTLSPFQAMPPARKNALGRPAGDECARLEELRRYGVLDTPPEQVFDDLALLAAQICGTPMALISLVDRDRHWFKSRVGIDLTEMPRQKTFCDHTIWQDDLLVVEDARRDKRFAQCAVVQASPHVRFYAGAPLRTPSGHALGTLCVFDSRPRRLDAQQKNGLCSLSRQVVVQMELKRTINELRHTALERHTAEIALRKSEERFQKFMNSGPAVAYVKDAGGRFVYVNEPTARRFQIPVAQWIGKTDAELLGTAVSDAVIEHDLSVLNDEKTVVAEEAVPAPDGARYWQSYKFLLHDDTGQKQVGGMSFDITERKAAEHERERLVSELREALAQVKTLSGFLPICASCKNIRDDAGYWQGIESYLSEHADVEFTHGICPDCVAKLYPEFAARQQRTDEVAHEKKASHRGTGGKEKGSALQPLSSL